MHIAVKYVIWFRDCFQCIILSIFTTDSCVPAKLNC
jgi:hypothetical protein